MRLRKHNIVALMLLILSSFSYTHLIAKNDHGEMLLQAARNAAKLGNDITAIERFEEYISINRDNGQAVLEMAGILTKIDQKSRAEQICQASVDSLTKLYNSEPNNTQAILDLAHLKRWMGQYDKASVWYQKYLTKKPDDKLTRLEQARLAGWNLEYDKAERYYKKLVKDFPEEVGFKMEMFAKTNNWLGWNIKASEYYKKALEYAPDDVELLFDLGQVYDRRMLYSKAYNQYERVLEIAPSHSMADQTRISEESRQKQYLQSNHLYLKKKGRGNEVDLELYRTDIMYSPIRGFADAEWQFGTGWSNLSVSGHSVTVNHAMISMDKIYDNSLRVKLNTEFSNYNQRPHQTFQFDSTTSYRFNDIIETFLITGQEDVIDNINTLNNGLSRYYVGPGLFINPFRNTSVFLYGKRFWYNDHNRAYEYDLRAEHKILKYPRILKIIGKFYKFDTSIDKGSYWTPNSYWRKSIGLGWYHYLDKQHYEGSENLYYFLEGHLSVDNESEEGQEIKTGIVYDSNRQLSFGIEYSAFVSDVYDQSQATAFIRYRW